MKTFDFMIKVNVRLNIQVEREDNATEEFDTIPEEIINEVDLLYSPVSSCLPTPKTLEGWSLLTSTNCDTPGWQWSYQKHLDLFKALADLNASVL